LFFLGTLAAIAFYVQGQSTLEDRESERKVVTILADEPVDAPPLPLPWKDRLDVSAATLVPILGSPDPNTSGAPTATPAGAVQTRIDAQEALYVQDLNDGHRILLTLDPVLQDSALTIFRNREVPYAGAVMIDLRDNAVLVLAGHSTMDPAVDPLEIVGTAWAPAASIFKLVTTAALLDSGAATPATKACFSGGLHGIEDRDLRDDPARDKRCETLSSAVAHSHNLVIGKLALKHLDQDTLTGMSRSLLFETEIPFEFNIERSPAHIPDAPTERAKVAAGFWNVDLSPIHAALMTAIFARGGMHQPPHIIARVIAPDGTDLTPPLPTASRAIAQDVADAVGLMMQSTTLEGTARSSFRDRHGVPYIRGVTVSGKTGSLTGRREPFFNYNWFVGFAPAERPEVAFAVLLANEPKWRIKAHYAGRRLIELYLERREAIARARDVLVTPQGLSAPVRDPSGAIVRNATEAANDRSNSPGGDAATADADPSTIDPPESPLPPLPPPPGALPKRPEPS